MKNTQTIQSRLIHALIVAALFLITGSAMAFGNPPPLDYNTISDTAPDVTTDYRFDESLRVSPALKANPINVEFQGSPLLTEQIKTALVALGYTVVNEPVKNKLLFKANFHSQGGGSKTINVALGPVIENSLKNQQAALARQDTNVNRGAGEAAFLSAGFGALATAGLLSNGFAIGNIVEGLGQATGVAGAFNKALTGDPRGWCTSRCHEWYKIRQEMAFFVNVTADDGNGNRARMIRKQAFHEKLVPSQLLGAALNEAFELLK